MLKLTVFLIAVATPLWAGCEEVKDSPVYYKNHPGAKSFIDHMVKAHKYDRAKAENLISAAEKKQSILDAISRPAEKTKAWHEYREIFLTDKRISGGVDFWNENAKVLAAVSKEYGVEEEIIVAIIGVETWYGRIAGSYRVIDALSTLSFDYEPRSKFFTGQLEAFLLLVKEQNQDGLALKGSYAGAMGYGQFMPSSYRDFARDHTGDGFADIWNNKADAIASVANYFKAHGWISGQKALVEAILKKSVDKKAPVPPKSLFNTRARPSLSVVDIRNSGLLVSDSIASDIPVVPLTYKGKEGLEYWVGLNNYYVITRYNRSRLYARAVWDLSQMIKAKKMVSIKPKKQSTNE